MQLNQLKLLLWLCVFTINLFPFATAVRSYGPCITLNRIEGNCVRLEDCKYLYNLLRAEYLSEIDSRYLRASQCGYVNQTVLLCCPPHQLGEPITTTTLKGNDLLPKYPNCGMSLSNRIYGGVQTEIGEFPWLALIEFTNTSSNERLHYCGGSLINERYVLTAAHCVDEEGLPLDVRVSAVRLGEWDMNNDPDDVGVPSYQDINIEAIIIHPGYRLPQAPNDIALLRLAQPARLNNLVMPICLPNVAQSHEDSFVNASMDVAGWGTTERSVQSQIMLKATVKVKDVSECQKKYSSSYKGTSVTSRQLCAGGHDGKDTCRGDSGGPLMFVDETNHRPSYTVMGIVSFGSSPCGSVGWPAVYTRVDAFVDWIEEQVKP